MTPITTWMRHKASKPSICVSNLARIDRGLWQLWGSIILLFHSQWYITSQYASLEKRPTTPMTEKATTWSTQIGGNNPRLHTPIDSRIHRSVGELFLRKQMPAVSGYGSTGNMSVRRRLEFRGLISCAECIREESERDQSWTDASRPPKSQKESATQNRHVNVYRTVLQPRHRSTRTRQQWS